MRTQGKLVVVTVLALLALGALAPLVAAEGGGVDPRLPDGVYKAAKERPTISFVNATIERGSEASLDVKVGHIPAQYDGTVEVLLEIYRWGAFGEERELEELSGSLPKFRFFDSQANDTVEALEVRLSIDDPDPDGVDVPNLVVVPEDTSLGYFRVRVRVEIDASVACSRGHLTEEEWRAGLENVREDKPPKVEQKNSETNILVHFLVDEAGFNVVPRGYNYVKQPSKVPDLGNFTTPVIRPGDDGTYRFSVTNRYDMAMTDVKVDVEFYMWATIEESKPLEGLDGPRPKVRGAGGHRTTVELGDIPAGGSRDVVLDISTSEDTPKGTYFVRHRIEFGYNGTTFVMGSRGHFTFEQWEGFDYSNLPYQLGTAGIVPDSSFSVKDPVPLWPLATLIALCVLLGALAVVFYLVEEHGDEHPRLKRAVQRLTGRWEARRRLWQARLEELRGEQDIPLEEGEAGP